MLDPQTRQQLQTKFQQVKPQLKQRFSGVTDQDLDTARTDPDTLIATISQKTGQSCRRGDPLPRRLRLTGPNDVAAQSSDISRSSRPRPFAVELALDRQNRPRQASLILTSP